MLSTQRLQFKHDHCTRVKQTNMYLVPKSRTECEKTKPVNAGINLAMELNIDVSLFSVFRIYKKMNKINNFLS